jgi:hypothetical protein
VELLAEELPRRVGSPLSHKSIAEDLEIDPKTVKRWIGILDSLYYSFQITPFGASKIRAVKKEQKLYLWDWSQVEDPGARFENMVASHLLKYCHYLQDRKPLFAVECKLADKALSPSIFYFLERLNIPKFYQVSMNENKNQSPRDGVILTSLEGLCKMEKLV